jgi:hypothetical protein
VPEARPASASAVPEARPASAPAVPDPPERSAVTAGVDDAVADLGPVPRPNGSGPEDREIERGLRGLVGSGSSQVGTGAALRARDAARPTAADLAEAEERLVVVRRNWTPRDEPGRSR